MFNFFKNHKKITIGAVILALVVFGAIKFLGKDEKKFVTAQVERGTIEKIVSASGEVKAKNQVDLKFQTSGRLAWVGIKEGDRVEKWQVIAQLDQEELRKNLEKALRDYSKERNDFEEEYRTTYLGQTPQTALTDTIKRILEKNQWDLEKAVLDVELKDIALKYSTLVTPISGIVTRVDAPLAGVNIIHTSIVFTIAEPESTYFSADIDEVDIGLVREGQNAKINLDAYYDEPVEGQVKRVSFFSITTSGGGTAYPTEITLPENIDERFKIGMNGDAEIIIEKREDVLIVPLEAVREKNGNQFVRLLEKGEAREVEVKVGLTGETKAEVLSGLQEGQLVIIAEGHSR